MGATHFLTKTLPKVAAEMALSVLAHNPTRVTNIVGVRPLIAALVASARHGRQDQHLPRISGLDHFIAAIVRSK